VYALLKACPEKLVRYFERGTRLLVHRFDTSDCQPQLLECNCQAHYGVQHMFQSRSLTQVQRSMVMSQQPVYSYPPALVTAAPVMASYGWPQPVNSMQGLTEGFQTLAVGQVPGAGIPAPPPTPSASRFLTDSGRNQTPLQRNLARLTRYGMSSITSGPGDRVAHTDRNITSEIDATSQQGSMINVGNAPVASSRVSVQATARDVASSISAAAKSRMSRMGSFSWRRG